MSRACNAFCNVHVGQFQFNPEVIETELLACLATLLVTTGLPGSAMVRLHNPFHRHKARVTPDDKQQREDVPGTSIKTGQVTASAAADVPPSQYWTSLKLSQMLHRHQLDKDTPRRSRLAVLLRWPSLDQKKPHEPNKARWRQAAGLGVSNSAAAAVHNARGETVPAEEMEATLQEREERVAAREARLERMLQDARIQSMGMDEARGVLDAGGEVLAGDMRRLSGNRLTVNQGMAAAHHALDATRGVQSDMREAIQAVASADHAAQHAEEWGAALAVVQEAADEPGPKRSGEGECYKCARLVEAVIAGLQPPECGVHRAIVLRLHDEHHGQLYVAGVTMLLLLSH